MVYDEASDGRIGANRELESAIGSQLTIVEWWRGRWRRRRAGAGMSSREFTADGVRQAALRAR